jgi:TonB-linked SusC/RagA family outer membrane protein
VKPIRRSTQTNADTADADESLEEDVPMMTRGVAVLTLLLCLHAPLRAQENAKYASLTDREVRGGPLLTRPARLVVRDVPLKQALDQMGQNSGVALAYSPSRLPAVDHTSCPCWSTSIGAALTLLLAGTQLTFSEMDGQVVISAPEAWPQLSGLVLAVNHLRTALVGEAIQLAPAVLEPQRQEPTITGVVVDSRTGTPIVGAQVSIPGSGRGTLTDVSGRFRLANLRGREAALEVVMLGYRRLSRSVPVGSQNLRLPLEETALSIDELVVTGTPGATLKRSIGNSVSRLDAEKIAQLSPIHGVGDLINGRVPSVNVLTGVGIVGAGPRIHIRGRGSIALSPDPLIYIDGVRANSDVATGPSFGASSIPNVSRLGDLNPEEIESIEIIKGPAAATLYGTEAANGVIQIITKKGRASDRPVFDMQVRQGANWFMNAEQRVGSNFAIDPATGQVLQLNEFQSEKALGKPDMFRTGQVQGYNASMRGGTDVLRYYLSGAYDTEQGVETTNDFQRVTGRMNLTLVPSTKYDINANVGVIRDHRNLNFDRGLSLMFALQFANPLTANAPNRGFNSGPPEVWRDAFSNFSITNRYIAGLQFNYRPMTWFTHRLTVGIDQGSDDNETVSELQPDAIRQFLSAAQQNGIKVVNRSDRTVNTLDYAGTVNAAIRPSLRSSTSFGLQYYRGNTATQFSQGQGFPVPGIRTVSSAASTFGGDDYVENITVGMYGQQQFSYQDRLFITGAVRTDNNSAFGKDFKWVTYPKLSGTWVISEEPFWKLGFVNELKLRTAYGTSGQQPNAFTSLRTYRSTTAAGGISAASPLSVGNPLLGPERGQELEAGFDAGLLKGRVGLEFTYYNKRTKGMILSRAVAPSSGFPNPILQNAGLVTNKGVELVLNATPISGRSFAWKSNINVSTNKSMIVDLDPNNPALTAVGNNREGYPIMSFFQRRVVSATFNSTTKRAENVLCDGGPGVAPVACATAPLLFVGQPLPKYEGGVSNDFTFFGHIVLHAQVDFQGGNHKRDETTRVRCTAFRLCEVNVRPELYDPIYVASIQTSGVSAPFYSDASFAKLREVSLSYTFPAALARRLNARSGSISIAARNLHTWTSYTGLDPESLSLSELQGFDYYEQTTTPLLASFLTSVRLTF